MKDEANKEQDVRDNFSIFVCLICGHHIREEFNLLIVLPPNAFGFDMS